MALIPLRPLPPKTVLIRRSSGNALWEPQIEVREPKTITQVHLGLSRERFVLTPEEARRKVDPKRKSLYCVKCWTHHDPDIKLPHVCDRCGHLMLVIRSVNWPVFQTYEFTEEDLAQGRADILDRMADRVRQDIYAAEDQRVMDMLNQLSQIG